MTPTPEQMKNRKEWADALESGEYTQWRGRSISSHGYACYGPIRYCCIGVAAAKLADWHPGQHEDGYKAAKNAVGYDDKMETMFVRMNDVEGKSFPEIAAWIRENMLKEETCNKSES